MIRPTRSGTSGSGQRAVGIEQAVGRERAQRPLAVGGDATDGEDRVDPRHHELVPTRGGVERDTAPDAHLDVVAELRARDLGERALDGPAIVAEEHDVEARQHPVAPPGLLHHREVGVAGAGPLEVLDLAPHPDLDRERVAERVAHQRVDLAHRERRHLGLATGDVAVGRHRSPGRSRPRSRDRSRTWAGPSRARLTVGTGGPAAPLA